MILRKAIAYYTKTYEKKLKTDVVAACRNGKFLKSSVVSSFLFVGKHLI
jgi:hypothetical protein